MELHTEAPNIGGIENGKDVDIVASLFPNISATGEPTNQIESHGHNLVRQNIETQNTEQVLFTF